MRTAIAFLTTLGGSRPPTADALPWFPVVGLLLGLALREAGPRGSARREGGMPVRDPGWPASGALRSV